MTQGSTKMAQSHRVQFQEKYLNKGSYINSDRIILICKFSLYNLSRWEKTFGEMMKIGCWSGDCMLNQILILA